MIGKSIQVNRRNIMAFLLALLMLALAAAPALAWYEEDAVEGQPARSCRVTSDSYGAPTVYCLQPGPNYTRPVAQQTLLRPSIARAEQGLFFSQVSTESPAQASSAQ